MKWNVVTFLALGLVGLIVGSYISVHVGKYWYPTESNVDMLRETLSAVISSPIAMTFGIFPSLGFYGPFHGVLMLLGMFLTICGTWMFFRSRRYYYAWLVCIGMVLWSHNNHLAFSALMSV